MIIFLYQFYFIQLFCYLIVEKRLHPDRQKFDLGVPYSDVKTLPLFSGLDSCCHHMKLTAQHTIVTVGNHEKLFRRKRCSYTQLYSMTFFRRQ